MIVVAFAVPQESKSFRQGLHHTGTFGPAEAGWVVGNAGLEEVLVVHSGIGIAAARSAAEKLFAAVTPRCVISCGYAGALDPGLAVGDLVVAENVSDGELADRARSCLGSRAHFGELYTSDRALETVFEKEALREKTGALAVDMETAAWVEACVARGVPLLAVRVISDGARQPIPVPLAQSYDLVRQEPRPMALAAYLAGHPWRMVPFMRFVHGLAPAAMALAEFLQRFLTRSAVQDESKL